MNKRIGTLSAIVLSLALTGSAMAATVLKLGHIAEATNPYGKGADYFAELVKQKNVFRVQVRLIDPPGWLRPGIEGVAKIEAGERLLVDIWTRRAVNWVRMKLWW